ncbi:glutamate-5-semialdehyde dehydrogenase [Candidatus Marinamargulisbacteria bacterium SCGC AG-414-C22]|nr:glutamate-5-semialdehyde dehydrogenase [Candidatus Marinamargulisbacteria bacterium SCGC AG-414-C22]
MHKSKTLVEADVKRIEDQCKLAYEHKEIFQNLKSSQKNDLLRAIATAILNESTTIINSNKEDIEQGKKNGLSSALLDRLSLTQDRIQGIADSILEICEIADPIGEKIESWTRPNGLEITKVRVPLGVIGIIYEARPNVTVDAIGIAIKSGNAIVLRGSASAYKTNLQLVSIIKTVVSAAGLNSNAIQLLEDTTRESVQIFVKMNEYLNLIIPRGGAGLINSVINTATVPCIETGVGNCHIYIDQHANLDQAIDIVDNAKTQRPSVCNACETILIHEAISSPFLTKLEKRFQSKQVMIKGCEKTCTIINSAIPATEDDWDTEYLDLTLAVKIVSTTQDACMHIKKHGTLHTEAILSENNHELEYFINHVDASTIITNASTRFTDGGEFGFGAEMGISTQKLHARGPMGLKELTSYKYIITGSGQVR